DVLGRVVTLDPPEGYESEALIRPIADTFGSLVSYSTTPLGVEVLRERALPGTLSSCLQIGRVFAQLPGADEARVQDLLRQISGARVTSGAIVERIATRDEVGHRAAIVIE